MLQEIDKIASKLFKMTLHNKIASPLWKQGDALWERDVEDSINPSDDPALLSMPDAVNSSPSQILWEELVDLDEVLHENFATVRLMKLEYPPDTDSSPAETMTSLEAHERWAMDFICRIESTPSMGDDGVKDLMEAMIERSNEMLLVIQHYKEDLKAFNPKVVKDPPGPVIDTSALATNFIPPLTSNMRIRKILYSLTSKLRSHHLCSLLPRGGAGLGRPSTVENLQSNLGLSANITSTGFQPFPHVLNRQYWTNFQQMLAPSARQWILSLISLFMRPALFAPTPIHPRTVAAVFWSILIDARRKT